MWSKYLRVKKKGDVVAIFHELHPDPIYLPLKKWEMLFSEKFGRESEKTINGLRQRKIIINNKEDDRVEFNKAVKTLECKLNQPRILYLMMTQGCNLACKYCPITAETRKNGTIALKSKDAFAGVDLWQEHLKDAYNPDFEYSIIFYGGEPLINRDVIKSTLAYLEWKKSKNKIPMSINAMIATNGILVDEEIIDLCKKHKVMVAVGLDGQECVNDELRVCDDGSGTYKNVVNAIELLVKNGIRTFASVTITPANINLISNYSSFFESLGVEKFGFNFLKGKALIDLVGRNGIEDYYRKATLGILENSRRQKNKGFEYQMEKRQTAFENKDFFPIDCTCYGSQLVIQADGQISNCPFYKSQLGQVRKVKKNFRIWNKPIVKEWRKRLPIYFPNEAMSLSGGGCAWSSYEINGNFIQKDDFENIFFEEVLNELIWERYERI